MARKRGGLAGIWDRNKKVIKPLAEVVAGAFGGPWAGAALGSAMNGLDREGQSGVGFDFGQGLKGGVEGYALGKVGQWGGDKLGSMFTGGSAPAAVAPAATSAVDGAASTLPSTPALQGGVTMPKVGNVAQGLVAKAPPIATSLASSAAPSLASQAGDFFKNNQYLLGQMFTGLAGQGGAQAQADYTKAQTDLLRRQAQWEEEDRQNKQAKTDLFARLLAGGFYGRPTVSV